MLGYILKILVLFFVGRLVLSALRLLGLRGGRGDSRQQPKQTKPHKRGNEAERVLGSDIVDADFEDVSNDPKR